jgi:hypothetical protein
MLTSAQNFAAVQTELDTVFYQEFEYNANVPAIATAGTAELFKPIQTTHAAYIQEIFKGSQLFDQVGEMGTVPEETPGIANKQTIYIKDFAKGVTIPKDFFDDNMHGVYGKMVSDLALKARISQDDNAFKLFRLAFTTALTADGSAICASHTLIGGGTQSNTATAALAPASLKIAIASLREQKDQAGVITGNNPTILLVSSVLFPKAVEVTDSALIADSTNNTLNVFRSAYGITVYSSPYLGAAAGGSDTAWFLMSRNHSVTRVIRQGIQTALTDWPVSKNRTYYYQANFREEVFCSDYVGIYGSTGTV